MWGKVNLILHTLCFLKKKQIVGQIFRRLRSKKNIKEIEKDIPSAIRSLAFNIGTFGIQEKYKNTNTFTFLNLDKKFGESIDWNYSGFGKLWGYNLEYFDYLSQEDIAGVEKDRLIADFYRFSVDNKRILEPYPISLRTINVIKYTIRANNYGKSYLKFVYQELTYLHSNYEFHILGNHLLENAFALCLGGAFFNNKSWRDKAIKILTKQLQEQILDDGAHFELSPMYHNIIFFRLMELIEWYGKYDERNDVFLEFCRSKAFMMLDWIENVRFENGDIPLFNDSAKEIAFDTVSLIDYANKLDVQRNFISLGDSGYRSVEKTHYEAKIDFAQIGASYQPGHAHADALSFIVYQDGQPLFVEQGTSTYNIGKRRDLERSTEAHNTVVVNGMNQSEVWGGFRVGKRAKTSILVDSVNNLKASHDGYKRLGVVHTRSFHFRSSSIDLKDCLSKNRGGVFYLHIHPDRDVKRVDSSTYVIDDKIRLEFKNSQSVRMEEYDYAESYNRYTKGQRLVVPFIGELHTSIFFN